MSEETPLVVFDDSGIEERCGEFTSQVRESYWDGKSLSAESSEMREPNHDLQILTDPAEKARGRCRSSVKAPESSADRLAHSTRHET